MRLTAVLLFAALAIASVSAFQVFAPNPSIYYVNFSTAQQALSYGNPSELTSYANSSSQMMTLLNSIYTQMHLFSGLPSAYIKNGWAVNYSVGSGSSMRYLIITTINATNTTTARSMYDAFFYFSNGYNPLNGSMSGAVYSIATSNSGGYTNVFMDVMKGSQVVLASLRTNQSFNQSLLTSRVIANLGQNGNRLPTANANDVNLPVSCNGFTVYNKFQNFPASGVCIWTGGNLTFGAGVGTETAYVFSVSSYNSSNVTLATQSLGANGYGPCRPAASPAYSYFPAGTYLVQISVAGPTVNVTCTPAYLKLTRTNVTRPPPTTSFPTSTTLFSTSSSTTTIPPLNATVAACGTFTISLYFQQIQCVPFTVVLTGLSSPNITGTGYAIFKVYYNGFLIPAYSNLTIPDGQTSYATYNNFTLTIHVNQTYYGPVASQQSALVTIDSIYNPPSPQITSACGAYSKIYQRHMLQCAPFAVNLTGIGSPSNGIYPALLSIIFNGAVVHGYNLSIAPGNNSTVTFENYTVHVYVNKTFNPSYYKEQAWASIDLSASSSTNTVTIAPTTTVALQPTTTIAQKRYRGINATVSPAAGILLPNQQITLIGTIHGGIPKYTYTWYLQTPGTSSYLSIAGNPACYGTQNCTFTPLTGRVAVPGLYKIYLFTTDAYGNASSSAPTLLYVTNESTSTPFKMQLNQTNTSVGVITGVHANLTFTNYNTSVLFNSKSSGTISVNSTPPVKPPYGYTTLLAFRINVTNSSSTTATLNLTTRYNCNIPADRIYMYIIKNGAWTRMSNYTIDSTTCTVSYSVPSDPIVGLFEQNATIFNVSTTQYYTTTVLQSGSSAPGQHMNYREFADYAVAVIVIAVIIAFFATRKPKRPVRPVPTPA